MSIKTMETLKDTLCKELDEYASIGQMNSNILEEVHMLTDTIKNIEKIIMLSEQSSYDGGGSGRSYSRGGSYGSYSGDNSYGNSYRGSSRSSMASGRSGRYSYGNDNEMVMEKLEEMMREVGPEEKETLRKAMMVLGK